MSTRSNQIRAHAARIEPHGLPLKPAPRPRARIPLPPLPADPDALARKQQVMDFAGMGKTRLYALIKEGRMPAPVKLGRSSLWRAGDVREAVKKLFKGAMPGRAA